MATLMIHCPKTQMPISTGIGMDQSAFETAELENNAVACPLCGEEHRWSKKDAFLLETK